MPLLRASGLFVALGLAPAGPGLAPDASAPPATPATPEPSGSAFELPTAALLDPYGPRSPGVARLRLDEILAYALQNPAARAAEEKFDAVRAQLDKARFQWLPYLDTTAMLTPGANIVCSDVQLPTAVGTAQDFQWCRSGKDPNLDLQTARGYFSQLGSAGVRFQLEANAVFPITTFGKIWALRDVAKHGVALATLAREQVRAEITLMTHQAHATLLLAREAIRILAEARDVVRQARTRVDKDLGPEDEFDQLGGANPDRDPSDRYRVGLAEVALEERMREARRVESLSLSALWALAGTAAPRGFDVAEERLHRAQVSGGLAPVARYRELAATHRPEAKMAAAAVQLRRAEEKLARRNFLPDLGVTVGVAWARTPAADRDMSQLYYLDPWNYSRATAALALRWRFDIHNKTFDLRRARAEVRAADYQREAALLLLGRDVETAYEELRAAGHSLEQIARAVDLSWKLVVSQEQRDMVGGGNTKDLIRSLTDWYEWRFKQTEALMAHNVALARLSRAVGTALVAQPKSGAAAVHSQ